MASAARMLPEHHPRRAILDLAPLELHCMNALWALEEGSVRQIQQALAPVVPRAYTTIMTIMDRLARKGIVTRFKQGRAYLYRANLTAEEARGHAVEQVVAGFFDGSGEALAAHLSRGGTSAPLPVPSREPTHAPPHEIRRSSARPSREVSSASQPRPAPRPAAPPVRPVSAADVTASAESSPQPESSPPPPKLDTTLL